jgi:carboxyl-terminal processing protease
VLPDTLNYSTQFGESSLDNPLPWDTISSVDYAKLNLVQPYLDELRRRSTSRLATNQDFIYIRQDVDEFLKRQTDKTASLNERELIKEHEAHQTALDAHEQERVARKHPGAKLYEITVKNSALPGLVEPDTNSVDGNLAATNNTANANPIIKLYKITYGTNSVDGNLAATDDRASASQKITGSDAIEFQRAEAARLDETEHILEDYISLLSSNQVLIAK